MIPDEQQEPPIRTGPRNVPALTAKCFGFGFGFVVVAIALAWSVPALSQVNNPAYADYLLVGRFGEICTMCEAVVLCETGDAALDAVRIPQAGSFSVYHLQTRTFWSQIATIWEWFIANFDSESLATSGHERPVYVYTVIDGRWSARRQTTAQLSLDPATMVDDDDTIDRVERRWLRGADSQPIGYCRRLPLWESLDVISLHDGIGVAP